MPTRCFYLLVINCHADALRHRDTLAHGEIMPGLGSTCRWSLSYLASVLSDLCIYDGVQGSRRLPWYCQLL
jgi:hypothetical protein